MGKFPNTLVWNGDVGALQGTVNLQNYVFNGSNGSFLEGNIINNFGFLLVSVPSSGSWPQTADLFAANYPDFTPFMIPHMGIADVAQKTDFKVANGKLFTSAIGNLQLDIYDFSGKLVKSENVNNSENAIGLNINTKGFYILKVKNNDGTTAIKFSN